MRLTNKQIAEFRRMYKKHFGIELTEMEAISQGLDLVSLIKLVHKPIKKEDYKKINYN